MAERIKEQYEDEMGNPVIDPTDDVLAILKVKHYLETDEVSFADYEPDFTKWAIKHRVPGKFVAVTTQKRYLQTYLAMTEQTNKPEKSDDKLLDTVDDESDTDDFLNDVIDNPEVLDDGSDDQSSDTTVKSDDTSDNDAKSTSAASQTANVKADDDASNDDQSPTDDESDDEAVDGSSLEQRIDDVKSQNDDAEPFEKLKDKSFSQIMAKTDTPYTDLLEAAPVQLQNQLGIIPNKSRIKPDGSVSVKLPKRFVNKMRQELVELMPNHSKIIYDLIYNVAASQLVLGSSICKTARIQHLNRNWWENFCISMALADASQHALRQLKMYDSFAKVISDPKLNKTVRFWLMLSRNQPKFMGAERYIAAMLEAIHGDTLVNQSLFAAFLSFDANSMQELEDDLTSVQSRRARNLIDKIHPELVESHLTNRQSQMKKKRYQNY